jgi:hypothetical protein
MTDERTATAGPVGPAGRRPSSPRPGARTLAGRRLALVRAVAQLWLEIEAGRRPPAHLEGLMDPGLVARFAGRWAQGAPAGRVLHVTGSATSPSRYDAVALFERGGRVEALAVRLTRDAAGWRVTEADCPGRSGVAVAGQPEPRRVA